MKKASRKKSSEAFFSPKTFLKFFEREKSLQGHLVFGFQNFILVASMGKEWYLGWSVSLSVTSQACQFQSQDHL